MKVNVLLAFAAFFGALGISILTLAGEQADKTVPGQPLARQTVHDPNLKGLAITDSEGTWGRHEPLKSCAPCHRDQAGQTSADKLPLVAPVPELCYTCHEKRTAQGGWVHGPVATGECLLCHEPHTASNKSLLSKTIPELCYRCHEADTLRLVANHSKESYRRCDDCHAAHTSPGRMLLKEDFLKTDAGLVYAGKNPSAQPRPVFVDRRESLNGLEGVEVVAVVDGAELFKRYGAAEDLVQTEVERQLQLNGIRILHRAEQTTKQSSLQVYLRLMEVPSFHRPGQVDALSGSFNLFLQQTVELLPSPGDEKRKYCTATTWDTGAILIWGTSQIEDGLKEAVEVLVGRFSKDYLAANHRSEVPTVKSD
ncbi:MAG: hypothetical protein A2Z25_07425 [Planctomycetes bacterium RBG_16_55_9]|nr:MAG: hypothetical protein A2Z25_07425 [Planctomycetes bacterium RBG_16_55_9]